VAAGEGPARLLETLPLENGVLWRESGFLVRAVQLDHDTPVLAYAWESAMQLKVRRERLQALGLKHGRWLQVLKEAVLNGRNDDIIATPDECEHRVQYLADNLLLVTPGQTLVYATDFADTPANRQRLTELAKGAHTLFCEATFMLEDADQAERTFHLTTRACAEIAEAAGVANLQPFHFSRRYTRRLPDVYREIAGFTSRAGLPAFMEEPAERSE
jgi:ribonuclease Z